MSFFSTNIAVPLWLLVFVVFFAIILWGKLLVAFYKSFILKVFFNKKSRKKKSDYAKKMDVLKKATDHWNENSEILEYADSTTVKNKQLNKSVDSKKRENIKVVLMALAKGGELGVIAKCISDKMAININEISNALEFLIEKKLIEAINSSTITKYYLTEAGKKYCIKKDYF